MNSVVLYKRRLLAPVFIWLMAVFGATSSVAHEVRPAYLQIQETAPEVFSVLWKQPAAGSLAVHLEPRVSNGLLEVPPTQEYSANSFVIRRWEGLHRSRESFAGATIAVDGLKETITDTLVDVRFLTGQETQLLLKPAAPAAVLHLTGTGNLPVPAYLSLGIEHILTGFDHLAFVLGLVLLIRSRILLLKTITAFTVAHSITLAAAALGLVHPNPPVIEALVALSIVFVAVELVRTWEGQGGLAARQPWLIAFVFGLLHGFAFAGSLADIGLPPAHIATALLLFNCGVEIGQLLFVGAVVIVLGALSYLPQSRRLQLRWVAPYGIGTLATFWMFERLQVLIG